MTRRIAVAMALVAVLAAAQTAQAADITWGAPQDITGNLSDFDDVGDFIYGRSGDGTDRNIPSVGNFIDADRLENNIYNADSNGNYATVYPGGDADYDNLLQNATWSNGAPRSIDLTGLTPGSAYRVQLWAMDARNCCSGNNSWQKTFGDGNGNNVTIEGGDLSGGVLQIAPQYVIGEFTADATTQQLEFLAIGRGNSHPQYNALMLRTGDVIPEPSSVVLFLAGLLSLGCCLRRRRRRA